MNSWSTRRQFWWGLVLLMDRDASDVPELADAVVSQSPRGLAVKVLHAQDVDLRGFENDEVIPPAEVQVDVPVGTRPSSDVLFSGVIDVPSGVLTTRVRLLYDGTDSCIVMQDIEGNEFCLD